MHITCLNNKTNVLFDPFGYVCIFFAESLKSFAVLPAGGFCFCARDIKVLAQIAVIIKIIFFII